MKHRAGEEDVTQEHISLEGEKESPHCVVHTHIVLHPIFFNCAWAVQCFAGYFDIEYGHLLDGEKQMGVIINTCKEFNLYHLTKGYLLIRATLPT